MTPSIIIGAYLILFIIEFLGHWFLATLNMGTVLKSRTASPKATTTSATTKANTSTVPKSHTASPEGLKERLGKEGYEQNVRYTLRKGSYSLYRLVEERLIIIAAIVSRGPAWLDTWITSWGWPVYWQAFAFITLGSFFLGVLHFPGTVYGTFVLEEEFGFNTMKPLTFLVDLAKETMVNGVILLIFLAGLYGVFLLSEKWWWLLAWGFWMIFQLIASVLYPLIVAPLFNTFKPLEEGNLKKRLNLLAKHCSFPNNGIFVMDGSRRSRHSNAYFTGIGRSRRIVLYDTLVKNLKDEELEAVLAHEIGHWKFGHIRRGLIFSGLILLAIFAIMGGLYQIPMFFEAFGFARPTLYGLVFWIILYAEPLEWFFAPIFNMVSRRHEYRADRFAVDETGGNAAPLMEALLTLSRENLSNISPHSFYSFWNSSHPILTERLKALEEVGSEKIAVADEN